MTWETRPRSAFGALAAIVAGEGPLVVLLHGVGLRAEAWAAQIDAFAAAGWRAVAPDMIGHGGTPAAPAGSIGAFAAPVVTAIDEPAVVIGHSMGAMLALEVAAACPGMVIGVAALNAIHRRDPAAGAAVRRRAAALDGVAVADPAATLHRWFGEGQTPERAACADWLSAVDPAGYKAAYTVFASSDGPADETLKALDCMALFMTGADEPNSTPAMSRAMAALAPKGEAVVLPGAAHMMPMTHATAVNARLLAFAEGCRA